MQFSFSDDQRLLAAGVRDFLAGECTPADVELAWTMGPDQARWKALAGLGLVGLLVPEAFGGMGMDEVDLVLALEAAGYAGLPEPLAEVAAVSVPLLVAIGGEAADELLPGIASGELLVLPALAGDAFPAHLRTAHHVLVQDGHELLVADPTRLGLVDQPNVDLARPTVSLTARVGAGVADVPEGCLAVASARGAWAASALLVGTARRMIDLATEYALQREQFGKPIGSFQAVKHQLANALVEVEFARPLVHRAAWSLANSHPDAALHCSMAKARAGEAAQGAARAALQVHGAIGYTWEHHLQLWMKRAWSLGAAWGPTEQHWQAIEAHVFA